MFRSIALAVVAMLHAAICSASGAESFVGVWEGCAADTCSVFEMHQRGTRVCGFWSYFATNSGYDGRFTGDVAGNRLTWSAVCGSPGGVARSFCPESSDPSSAIPGAGESFGWAPYPWVQTLCKGRLVDGPSKTCVGTNRALIFRKVSGKRNRSPLGESPPEREWLSECLAGANPTIDWRPLAEPETPSCRALRSRLFEAKSSVALAAKAAEREATPIQLEQLNYASTVLSAAQAEYRFAGCEH